MKRIILLTVCAIVVLLTLSSCNNQEHPLTAAELLDLGEKYLLEMDYEQAAVYFTKLIEVEPMNPRGYTGLAEAYLGLEDADKAIEILQQGLATIPGDANIQSLLDELLPPKHDDENTETTNLDNERRELLLIEIDKTLSEFAALISNDDTETVAERLMQEFNWIYKQGDESSEGLSEFLEIPHIIDTEHGKIGIYEAIGLGGKSQYWIYHGGFSDNSREGVGIWIGENSIAEGTWSDDNPNGLFEQRTARGQLWTSVGNVVDGLWHGERVITISAADGSGEDNVHIMQFENGFVQSFVNEKNGQIIIAVDAMGNPNLGDSGESLTKLWGLLGFGEKQW